MENNLEETKKGKERMYLQKRSPGDVNEPGRCPSATARGTPGRLDCDCKPRMHMMEERNCIRASPSLLNMGNSTSLLTK